jgi:hypothetical protein
MTDDLAKKLRTAGSFDPPWLKEQLLNWNAAAEQKKADFMEHMYQCSGRHQDGHPMNGLYTGLWQDFCINEAGPYCRDEYYRRLEFVRDLEAGKFEGQEVFVAQ